MKRIINKYNFYILGAAFVFMLFFVITRWTPLAGDDWGYAINGMNGNPFKTAMSFYQTWSGRFFSELWGFVVAPRKYLWNILNPLLFTLIFIFVYRIGFRGKNPILCVLLILAAMFSVDDHLRMETFTWIMGTTYVVPLMFSLFYFVVIKKIIFDGISKRLLILNAISNVTLFIGGMMMENISACMVGGIVILIIYCYFTDRKELIKYLLFNFVFATVSLAAMRLSPGSAFRLARDNAEWLATPLFTRVVNAYPNFLKMTFTSNNYMIMFLSAVLSIQALKKLIVRNVISIVINVIAVFAVFSFVLIKGNNVFVDESSIFSMLFWPVYVVNAFVCLFNNSENNDTRDLSIFILVIAGANALAMLFSPIYGSRSAIYTVFYIITLAVIVLSQIELNKISVAAISCIFVFVIADRTNEYLSKYRSVAQTNEKRMLIIEYYRQHPEDEDVWIPRYGIYTIHSGDVEEGDTYHFETFKNYYGLPQSADNIHFYYEEN